MTTPIDPIHKAAAGRSRRSDARRAESSASADDRNLPVPVSAPSVDAAPPPQAPADGAAVFAAQLLGQDGQKRGLRGGPATLDAAKSSYARTEWSGSADRRARRGGAAKTEI
ncbi:hypothetical protein [Phenylobacterium sp.]|uniref:hypothetical protein n=1 Tax=Phenylobacterium sp. TaxID=1871053 RepID=UPI002736B7AA|nr:hypothetical protein [Phenylobacterium sp.]MDP3660341.1 hypothetical protein [Phenylobacterium sp.]